MRHITAPGAILGVVAAVPSMIIRNADCPNPQDADEAAKLTGVLERRWVRQDQSARSLCTEAAARLLGGIGWLPSDVDVLIYVTQTPTSSVPADVYTIAAELGLAPTALCMQVNWSCSGYVYGLLTAMRMLAPSQRGLLLVGDATSQIADPGDRATAPLFGDAGSATAIIGEEGWERPMSRFVVGSDGTGADRLAQGPGEFLHMDGAAVFNFTLKRVPQLVADVLEHGKPDFLLFHQANRFMLDHLVKKSKLLDTFRPEQIPTNIARFGNCSCASIPLLMCTELDHWLTARTNRLAMFGFGAGWAWCGASIECQELQVCELLEV